jgi:hypothetical protein
MTDAANPRDPLAALAAAAESVARPVERWDPPDCGDIDIRIAADGRWYHEGVPIAREGLVRLFASILRRDGDRHVLVTPVEKLGIIVEDAPFLAVEMRAEATADARALAFRTNLDDWTVAGPDRPLRFDGDPTGGLRPYVLVRGGLWARLTRPLLYDLVDLGEQRTIDGEDWFGVASRGAFFPIERASALEAMR